MIPTVLGIGLLAGLTVRSWWPVTVLAVAWAGAIAISYPISLPGLILAAALGGANAAVAVAVGRGLRTMVDRRRVAD